MCAVLALQSNLVIVDQANASCHLGFSNLMAERLLVTGLVVGDIAVDDLVHSHRDGVGAGKRNGDVVDILNGKHAVMLAAQHAIDIASTLGGKRSEQEAVVIGLPEDRQCKALQRTRTSDPFMHIENANELIGRAVEIVIHHDVVVAVGKGKLMGGVCHT